MKIVFCVEISAHQLGIYFTVNYGYVVHHREPDVYADTSDNATKFCLNSAQYRAQVDRLEPSQRPRERDRERVRPRERDRDTERQRDRERERETETETEKYVSL